MTRSQCPLHGCSSNASSLLTLSGVGRLDDARTKASLRTWPSSFPVSIQPPSLNCVPLLFLSPQDSVPHCSVVKLCPSAVPQPPSQRASLFRRKTSPISVHPRNVHTLVNEKKGKEIIAECIDSAALADNSTGSRRG